MRLIAGATLTLTLLSLAATAAQPQARFPAENPLPRVEQLEADVSAKPRCDRFDRAEQADEGAVLRASPARPRRLNELPAGDLHLAVVREVAGCQQPAIVRHNVGGAPFERR